MKNQNRITRLFVFSSTVFLATYICLSFQEEFSYTLLLFFALLIAANFFLLKLVDIKVEKSPLSFTSKIAYYSSINIAAFLPMVIQDWGTFDLSSINLLGFSILLCSTAFALFSTNFPDKVAEDDEPFYDLPDVLLQPRKSSGRANPIRVKTEHNNPVLIQFIVWLLIGLLVWIPFHFFLL